MSPIARWLVFCGLLLVAAGVAWQLVGQYLPLGRLPGDIAIERHNVRFYFPLVTCLIVSAVLTLASWLWRSMQR